MISSNGTQLSGLRPPAHYADVPEGALEGNLIFPRLISSHHIIFLSSSRLLHDLSVCVLVNCIQYFAVI
jgi:hypothetical protein